MNNGRAVLVMFVVGLAGSVGNLGATVLDGSVDITRLAVSLILAMMSFMLRIQQKLVEENIGQIKEMLANVEKQLIILNERTSVLKDLIGSGG